MNVMYAMLMEGWKANNQTTGMNTLLNMLSPTKQDHYPNLTLETILLFSNK